MGLVAVSIAVTLLAVAGGLTVATVLYRRGRMPVTQFRYTALVLFGLSVAAGVVLIDAPSMWYWLGLGVVWAGFLGLRGRDHTASL